ncbi:hypothetical protein IQ254_16085 [Nodosilinea sp. LEGE 07088]|uniref:hypothetical protein n=1 Tax=Nodosilinea sp. LEGE 07088 TaxID=2777968 RepID=UPI001881151C|nr:hypothetical protein [Nodosilinea sp. LEGE 07088]MBE9138694.1 hypothetical protein [Nodosilinea sp. LEGE 07088]
MGLIKSIFGAIFGLIGGIFKAIGGLVGLGKKSEFYMELDEASSDSQPVAAPSTPAPAAKAEPKPAGAPAKAKAEASAKAPKPVAPAPAVPAEPVPTAFASKYLTTVGISQSSRRRPGPSLAPFKDMAKQVNGR